MKITLLIPLENRNNFGSFWSDVISDRGTKGLGVLCFFFVWFFACSTCKYLISTLAMNRNDGEAKSYYDYLQRRVLVIYR